jgi:hypothetical protein
VSFKEHEKNRWLTAPWSTGEEPEESSKVKFNPGEYYHVDEDSLDIVKKWDPSFSGHTTVSDIQFAISSRFLQVEDIMVDDQSKPGTVIIDCSVWNGQIETVGRLRSLRRRIERYLSHILPVGVTAEVNIMVTKS